jgi:hypothetical protein
MLLGSGSKDHGLLEARIGGKGMEGRKRRKEEDLPKKTLKPE